MLTNNRLISTVRSVRLNLTGAVVMTVNWRGVFPAATTQFKADYSLDLSATMRHLDVMINAGVHGMIMLGTVGENCSLEYREKLDLLKASVERVAGRVPLLTGVAECSTALACRFATDAQKIGVNGLMVLPAMVYKSDSARETMTRISARVAGASDACPSWSTTIRSATRWISRRKCLPISPTKRFVLRHQGIVGECPPHHRLEKRLRRALYLLFCGVDDLVLESIVLSVSGWVSGLVNAFPR